MAKPTQTLESLIAWKPCIHAGFATMRKIAQKPKNTLFELEGRCSIQLSYGRKDVAGDVSRGPADGARPSSSS
jgi:hypothetical protein